MVHRPVLLKNLALSFPRKTCFEAFTAEIHPGARIAIVGQNGSGKTTLLKMILGLFDPSEGEITVPGDVRLGYVQQVIEDFDCLSGGERLNQALTRALANDPNVLLLDEPTNHLDLRNRRSLMRCLASYRGTLLVVSHDTELLRTQVNILWHIGEGKIDVFAGSYDCYVREREKARESAFETLSVLRKERREVRAAAQAEVRREAGSRCANRRENDRSLLSGMKESGSRTAGRLRGALNKKRERIDGELRGFRLPEVIRPRFSLEAGGLKSQAALAICGGSVWRGRPLVEGINLTVGNGERVALFGDNGSGKTTIVQAILGEAGVGRAGEWYLPQPDDIGYLDQHYATLQGSETVLDTVRKAAPTLPYGDIRSHLNDFLFRKNEEVLAPVSILSGGEKARLSLALIAARTPRLLILDEATNNIDLETREHLIQVLIVYPGAMLIISHDRDFLERVGVSSCYEIRDGAVFPLHDW
jgi:ATPase subunit of ABC transporter with duplicated ATPase domains